MNPVVIDTRSSNDDRDVIHRAVQALAEGKIVALPTETVYGLAASALNVDAVERLVEIKQRKDGHALALAVKSADAALDYIPGDIPLNRRLARRCWPGPVTLIIADSHPDSLIQQLPPQVQKRVAPTGTIGLRVPGHRLVLEVLRLMAGPMVLSSANRAGQPEALTSEQVVETLGSDVDLVIDDGKCQYGQASSVVQIESGKLKLLREGVVGAATFQRLSSFMVMMVCTGNTCRSPMAEILCRNQIAKKIGCKLDELEDKGVIVQSAGIAAASGAAPSEEAVQVMGERGLDLSGHIAQPVTDRLVRYADLIFTMTQGHRHAIVNQWPDAAERTHVLSTDHSDVSDPIGGTKELYKRCADQIESAIVARLDDFDLS